MVTRFVKKSLTVPRIVCLALIVALLLLYMYSQYNSNPYWLGEYRVNFVESALVYLNNLEDLEITVDVISGDKVNLCKSCDITTLMDGKITRLRERKIDTRNKYLLATLVDKGSKGHICVCDVLVLDGQLKGSVIHIRDGMYPSEGNYRIFQAIYEIPESVEIAEQRLPVKIVGWFAK
ncbi:MAG: hypothetical protein NZ585_10635 [Chloracidobacterium sp.]|nr:hypothetical protein [Chloracidobacterium sp.]MDW8217669.1 hypothetical protein [Acidobacteriota bacterium]